MIFEGEFKNGEIWNGYGEKGWFEGEFKNGKKCNGKGKDFFYGSLIYEGENLNGKRNGKGKEFDSKGNLILEEKI